MRTVPVRIVLKMTISVVLNSAASACHGSSDDVHIIRFMLVIFFFPSALKPTYVIKFTVLLNGGDGVNTCGKCSCLCGFALDEALLMLHFF